MITEKKKIRLNDEDHKLGHIKRDRSIEHWKRIGPNERQSVKLKSEV